MYRVKFLQVSTGQILGLLPLYQLDYRNHHHQLINVHESVRNIFLPIIIFIAIIFRHIWASSTLDPSSPSASIWSQQPTQQVSNIILPMEINRSIFDQQQGLYGRRWDIRYRLPPTDTRKGLQPIIFINIIINAIIMFNIAITVIIIINTINVKKKNTLRNGGRLYRL